MLRWLWKDLSKKPICAPVERRRVGTASQTTASTVSSEPLNLRSLTLLPGFGSHCVLQVSILSRLFLPSNLWQVIVVIAAALESAWSIWIRVCGVWLISAQQECICFEEHCRKWKSFDPLLSATDSPQQQTRLENRILKSPPANLRCTSTALPLCRRSHELLDFSPVAQHPGELSICKPSTAPAMAVDGVRGFVVWDLHEQIPNYQQWPPKPDLPPAVKSPHLAHRQYLGDWHTVPEESIILNVSHAKLGLAPEPELIWGRFKSAVMTRTGENQSCVFSPWIWMIRWNRRICVRLFVW